MTNNSWNSEYNSAKGALLVGNATRPIVRTIGSDGDVLTADSAQADGVNWLPPGAGGTNTFVGNFGPNASPVAGSLNVLGNMGCITIASGNTIEINSIFWTTQIIPYTPSPNTGVAILVMNPVQLPIATVGQVVKVFAQTAGTVITAQPTQTIQNNATISVLGGTATSTADGDTIEFVMNSAGTGWLTFSRNGTWIVV